MRVDFDGCIITITEVAYSYADSKKDGSMLFLPQYGRLVLPGRLIRGCLRHRNFARIIRRLRENEKKLELLDWQFNLLGGIKQEGSLNYNVLLDRPLFESHPFVGLWGCMEPVGYTGKVQVEIAYATSDIMPIVVSGQRTDPVQRGEVTRDDVASPDKYDDYIRGLGIDSIDRKERAARATARKQGKNDDNGAPEGPRKMPQNLPHSRQMIPRGVEFEHHMVLKRDTTEVQLGQFFLAFEEFATDPFLGAQTGINGGIVDMHYTVKIDGQVMGRIDIDGRARTLTLSDGLTGFVELFWNKFPDMDFSVPKLKKDKE